MLDHFNMPLASNAPLSYFHLLLRENKLNAWKRDFFFPNPLEAIDELINVSVDLAKEERTYLRWVQVDRDLYEFQETTESFSEVLEQKLRQGEEFADEYIRNYIYSASASERVLFIERVLNEILLLKGATQANKEATQYPVIKGTLEKLENTIKTIYKNDLTVIKVHSQDASITSFRYKWKSTKALRTLNELFMSLTANGKYSFLDPDTKWVDFKRAFTGEQIQSKLVWVGALGDLRFLITELLRSKKIEQPKGHWQIATNCFLHLDGKTKGIVNISPEQLSGADHTKTPINRIKWELIAKWVDHLYSKE